MLFILMLHILLSVLFSWCIYIKDKSWNYAITALLLSLALPGFGMVLFSKIRFGFLNDNLKQKESDIGRAHV